MRTYPLDKQDCLRIYLSSNEVFTLDLQWLQSKHIKYSLSLSLLHPRLFLN